MAKHAIFLSGPVGAGKTTLGRTLAGRLSGGFVDGDDFSDSSRPWYCSILQTSRAIVRTGAAILENKNVVVVAYPLSCINWIYFRRKLAESGANTIFVSLQASYAAIVDERRGRAFSADEHDRIQTMIAQGYGARPFSSLIVDSGKADFLTTLVQLESEVRRMIEL